MSAEAIFFLLLFSAFAARSFAFAVGCESRDANASEFADPEAQPIDFGPASSVHKQSADSGELSTLSIIEVNAPFCSLRLRPETGETIHFPSMNTMKKSVRRLFSRSAFRSRLLHRAFVSVFVAN